MKQQIGMGWEYDPIKDIYIFNNGEFNVTRDIVQQRLKDWGKEENPSAYILDVLGSLYREFFNL
jgi:hypothetical protein